MPAPTQEADRSVARSGWLDLPADEAGQVLESKVAGARRTGDLRALSHGLLWLGRVRGALGLEEDAAAALGEARSVAERLGEAALVACVDIAHAWNDADLGHHARALEVCRGVLDGARSRGDGRALREANIVSGASLTHLGEHDLAVEHFEEARASLPARPSQQAEVGVRHHRGRCGAGLAQAWLMRAGLLQEAGNRQAAAEAFERARQLGERACDDLADAPARLWAPALFALLRVLLEAGDVASAQAWRLRLAVGGRPAPPASLALAQQTIGQAMLDLRAGGAEAGLILQRLTALEGARHPRLVAGDLRLALLRCTYEACEADGRYEAALGYQQQWAELKARLRGRLATEHGRWTAQTLVAWRSEASDVVTAALRQPLLRAAQLLDALPLALGTAADATTAVSRARHSMARAIDIADQYLGVMRAEHLRQEDMQPMDLSVLVDDVCEQMAPPAGAGVALRREIEPGLCIRGDRVLLMRALGNLLSNAFKHAPPGTAIRVGLVQRAHDVRLSVADHGPGMTLEMRARLFQRFATGTVRKGNGLGLAMVARVARLHGARIEVDSEPGRGTEVGLVLERAADGGQR